MKILIMCILLCLTVTPVHANEDIRHRMNIIAIEMAKCQGAFRANGGTFESTKSHHVGGNPTLLRAQILLLLKTEELDRIESETYDMAKRRLENGTEELAIYADKCPTWGNRRNDIMLRFFDEVGIDSQAIIARAEINGIAMQMALCQGIIRANGITLKSKGPGGKTLRSTAQTLSFIKTEQLDKLESAAYDNAKKILEKNTEEAFMSVEGVSHNCILRSTRRENAILGGFDKVGIDYGGKK